MHFAVCLTQTLLKHLELLEWGSQHYESLIFQNIISLKLCVVCELEITTKSTSSLHTYMYNVAQRVITPSFNL